MTANLPPRGGDVRQDRGGRLAPTDSGYLQAEASLGMEGGETPPLLGAFRRP
jgi:hypothetical protein